MSNHSYWSSSARYDQFAVDSYLYLSNNLHQLTTEYRFPQQFFEDVIAVTRNNKDPLMFIHIALLTVGLTMLRYAFTYYIVKPIGRFSRLLESEQDKLPECTWNFFYYSIMWLLAAYILIVKEKGVPLLRPESMFNDWQFTKALPFEYHVLYIVQLSFYLHSIYAIIAMDRWRKDSTVMVFHHMIAISLIFSGFSIRMHQVGAVVLFLHDICDVFLEGSKCALCFKDQGGKKYPIFEMIGNFGFVLFSSLWFCSRLYVFPLRLIWSCTTVPDKNNIRIPLSFMINVMLYLLLIMNLYWFTFIVKMIYKVATTTDELQDLREYEKKSEVHDTSSDPTETNKNLLIDPSDDTINKNDAIESTSANDVRKRSKVGHRSN